MTSHQARTLAAIRKLAVDGVPPSYNELRAELGFNSISSVHRVLTALERHGLVRWRKGEARSLEIIEDGVSPAALNALSDAALRRTAAHIAGILAHRQGGYATATQARRIADALLAAPKGGAE